MKRDTSNKFEFSKLEISNGTKTKTDIKASGFAAVISSLVFTVEALGTHMNRFLKEVFSFIHDRFNLLKRNYFYGIFVI